MSTNKDISGPGVVAPNSQPAPSRLVSLDVFRGLTVVGMVLVNNPGSWAHIYWPLEHAEPLFRAIRLRVQRRQPARDRELLGLCRTTHRRRFDQ